MAVLASSRFSAAFYSGGASSGSATALGMVALNGRPYAIEPSLYKRRTMPAIKPTTDTTAEPADAALNVDEVWRRTQVSFKHGCGQKQWDAFAPKSVYSTAWTDRERFYQSLWVNPWGEAGATVHRKSVSVLATANGGGLALAGARVYALDGQNVKYWAASTATASVGAGISTCTGGPAATATGIATDGKTVWVAFGASGIYSTNTGTGALTLLIGTAYTNVWYTGGRLFAATSAGALYELKADGTVLTTFTTGATAAGLTGFTWTAVERGTNAIYAAGYAGTQGYIFRMEFDSSTGGLRAALVQATSWPSNETVLALKFYGGYLAIGTSKGFRLSQPASDGSLTYGPVVEVGAVYAFAVDGRYLHFTWSSFTLSYLGTTYSGTGRADLSVDTTGALTPAYATEMMVGVTPVTTTALVRTADGRSIFYLSGTGFYEESDTSFEALAVLDVGEISLGVAATKQYHTVDLRTLPLVGSVQPAVVLDSGVGTGLATFNTAGATQPAAPISIGNLSSEAARLVFTLVPGASSPTLARWTLRASIIPQRVDEFEVPIIWASEVQVGAGDGLRAYPFDLGLEMDAISALISAGTEVLYQEGPRTYRVRVVGREWQGSKWGDRWQYVEGICTLLLHTTTTTG